ncbi:MAG: rRNA maturation RNase YbeY [Xanthomonadaceae bacterium]|nr:rRNA maturation RNase YbeY [Xanthomonadaceae bacterium]
MHVEIQRQIELPGIPDNQTLSRFVAAVISGNDSGALCLRIVDEAEGRALNLQWRGKDYATNVLSFAAGTPVGVPAAAVPNLLGDIVLCAPVIAREAQMQGKALEHHWAHLIVHGILHLRGHDHVEPHSAALMEQVERDCLAQLAIPDPYADESDLGS